MANLKVSIIEKIKQDDGTWTNVTVKLPKSKPGRCPWDAQLVARSSAPKAASGAKSPAIGAVTAGTSCAIKF